MRRLVFFVLCLVALGSVAVAGTAFAIAGTFAYDSIRSPLPGNVPSQPFQAQQTAEFGDDIQLAGSDRYLSTVTVTMSAWAKHSDWTVDYPSNTGFDHPITLNVYKVDTSGANPELGSLITTTTQTITVPWRPEADPTCATPSAWRQDATHCYNGLAFNATFTLAAPVKVPGRIILGIAYNTQSWGETPIGVDGPYNSLNVGLNDVAGPTAGTDSEPDAVFWKTATHSYYSDSYPNTSPDAFRRDTVWAPYVPMFQVTTLPGCTTTCFVDDDGNDLNTGLTPAAAKKTIQAGIDEVSAGGEVRVLPGAYNETAAGRTLVSTAGTYQFGLFFPASKPGIDLIGVDADNLEITDADLTLATINTNATNDFGPSGIFVEADDITIQGVKIGPNAGDSNKTIEVIGDSFRQQYVTYDAGGWSLYINDFTTAGDVIETYEVLDSNFTDATSIDIASGAGLNGPASGRVITGNTFDLDGNDWNAISFNGADTGVPWFTNSVGGAVITGNSFSNGLLSYIRARGTYDNSQFDWASFWNDNTFDKAAVVGPNPPSNVRGHTYTSGTYTFNNTRRIGATIQGEVANAATDDTVLVRSGTYDEDVNLNVAGVKLVGSGIGNSTIVGPIGGAGSTITIAASNVRVDGFTITRAGSNSADWNNPGLNTAGIAIQGSQTGADIRNNELKQLRTGIDINNSSGHSVHNNVINDNRTGMILRNQTDNLSVFENAITNNWTVGVLFLDAQNGAAPPPNQQALNSAFFNNNISGNWYGQIVDRQASANLPAPGTTNLKNFSGNWLGTAAPVVTTANSAEPGYAAQIPNTVPGGSAMPPGGQPDIAGPASANVDYTPWLHVGTDTNVSNGTGTIGFQGSFASLHVDDNGAQTGSTGRIQEGVNLVTASGTLRVGAGAYGEDVTIAKVLTLKGAQAGNPFSGRTFGDASESTVTGKLTLQAAVDMDGFSSTNTSSTGAAFAVVVKTAGSGTEIRNDIFKNVTSTLVASGNATAQAIYVENGPDNVSIHHNKISDVSSERSAKGILIGDSAATDASLGASINANTISDITSTARGAYGIQVSNAAGTGVSITNNTISTLTGNGWVHAIGLERDTPNAVITGNVISGLTDQTPTVPTDAIAVWFEANPSFASATVNRNSLAVGAAQGGIIVHSALTGGSVAGTCNWWGDASGPGSIASGSGSLVSANVTYAPWLTSASLTGGCLDAALSPTTKAYGSVVVNATSADQTFTLTNTGDAALHVGTVTIGGTDPTQFIKGTDTCTGQTVGLSGTCVVHVTFQPTSTGGKSGTLTIPSDASTSPDTASLSGTGVQPAASLTPASKAYGDIQVGSSSGQTFTLTNTGDADLHVGTASIGGTDPTQFSKGTDTCTNTTVTAGNTCTVDVAFQPSSTGGRSATLSVPSDAPGSPSTASLSGTGIQPAASLTPSSKSYGDILVGGSSAAQTFTLTNTGSADLHMGTVAIAGTNPGQFAKGADSCTNATVTAGNTCTVDVSFQPTSTGSQSATLSVPSDAPGSPSTASLSGTGIQPGASLSPTSKAYGSVVVDSSSADQTFTLTNTGSAPLHVGTVSISGDATQFPNGTDTCTGVTLAASGTCAVHVTFHPTSTAAKSATLSVPSDAPGSPNTSSLTGTGTQPGASLSPTSKAYGSVVVDSSSADQTFTLSNTGSAPLHVGTATVGGADPTQFPKGTDGCAGATLAVGGTCDIHVTFHPTSSGAKAGTLSVPSDAPGTPTTASLTGTGALAAAGSITIVQDSQPNHSRNFAFSGSLGAFSLDDDANAALPNQRAFVNLTAGEYTVTQGPVSGWSLVGLTCNTGESTNVGTRTATISLGAGENVTCTFTDTKRQPDGKISTFATRRFVGDNIYASNPLPSQTKSRAIARGATRSFFIKVGNDSLYADSINVRATLTGSSRLMVAFFRGTADITSQVIAGTYTVANLAAGGQVTIEVRVTARLRSVAGSSRNIDVRLTSASAPGAVDVVRAHATRA
jgi:hypothetical protein